MTDLDPWTSPRPEHPDMALYRQHAAEWQVRYPDTSQPARERHSGGGKWSTLVLLGDDWTPSYPEAVVGD